MKKISNLLISTYLLVLLSLLGCSKNEFPDDYFIEGETAKVTLHFDVNSSDYITTTKAAQSTYYEYLVQNVYVFVFSGDKRVATSTSFFNNSDDDTVNDISNYINKDDAAGNKQSSGDLYFETVAGKNMTICAVANIGTSNSKLPVDDGTKATVGESGDGSSVTDSDIAVMDAIETYSELQQLKVTLGVNTVSRGASFLMTGEVDNATLQGNYNVTIPLERTDSKITFNVSAATNSSSGYTDMKFIPGKWRVVNAPTASWVLPPAVSKGTTLTKDLDATTDADFFSVAEDVMPQFEGAVSGTENSGTFTFYMYENLKKPAELIVDANNPNYTDTYEQSPLYALREKQSKTATNGPLPGQTYINGEYVNAPKYATYVVFNGELSYTDTKKTTDNSDDSYVIADVEYCVHLGHSGESNVNDYSTYRNSHYTYNVTITGVNSLIVEVDTPTQEERPGAEGDVVVSAAEIINIDGHYDRAVITLTPEEAGTIYFAVSTPWERGLDANGFATSETIKDYKWIKFLINSDVDITTENQLAKFPGEHCYDGGKTETGTAAYSGTYQKDVVLRDIRQLSKYLNQNKPTENIQITAFIDEYIYYYVPTSDPLGTNTTYKGVTSTLTADDLLLWKQSVNKNDRMLHIVKAGDMKYSADGHTSVSRSVVTFKQRPVLTFYNVNASGLITAWGTETINEIPLMTVSRTSYPTTTNYNYYQQAQRLTQFSGTNTQNSWSVVVSSEDRYGLGSNYNDPSYACAIRNRDFDGDGQIDGNEVQWYLASLGQMSDLWIGEPAMPKYAHMYDEDNPDGKFGRDGYIFSGSHFVTSTISGTSPMVYWAEEFGASSTHDQAISWRQAPTNSADHQTKYINYTSDLTSGQITEFRPYAVVSVRCVRNLGLPYNSTELPQDYITISGGTPNSNKTQYTSNIYQINLDYINTIALRTVVDGGNALPNDVLNTTTENNRPYISFLVYPTSYLTNSYDGYTWSDIAAWNKNNESNSIGCPDGYRLPNQREMAIMSAKVDGWSAETYWNGGIVDNWYTMLNHQIIKCYDINGNLYKKTGCFFMRQDNFTITRGVGNAVEIGAADPEPSAHQPAVRCVKDNQGYSIPSGASVYNDGGNITGN